MYSKIDRYILIAILVVVIIVLYFSYKNNKDTGEQSSLLLSMANRLDFNTLPPVKTEQVDNTPLIPREETPEDGPEIIRIAEKIYSGKDLTAHEKQFQIIFANEINEEIEFCHKFYPLVKKFIEGEKEFTDEEKQFYENNSEAIESELKRLRSKQLDNDENSSSDNLTGANPPLAPGERLKMILSFFEDGIPKTVTQLADLYASKTGTKASKGNISTIFSKLEGNQLLWQKIEHNSRWKVFYGLPEWFDGKKLKKEFKQKIS